METQLYELTANGLKPISKPSTDLIGTVVLQHHHHKKMIIVATDNTGYICVSNDDDLTISNGQRIDDRSPFCKITQSDNDSKMNEAFCDDLYDRAKNKRELDRQNERDAYEQKKARIDALTQKMRDESPIKISISKYGSPQPAQNLKKLLKHTFPHVDVIQCKIDKYSGGSSIDVYMLNATDDDKQKIKSLCDSFEVGNFDGMEDIYNYKDGEHGRAFRSVYGGVSYVFEHYNKPFGME